MDLDERERIHFGASDAAEEFAATCGRYHVADPYPGQVVPLDHAINTLMTALWDQGFSQTEIRTAFEAALADMNRYTAGEERR